MSDIKINNPNDFDMEGAFLSLASRVHPEMIAEQQARLREAELHAQQTADSVEISYHNKQSAVVLGISAVAFAIGWAAGKR